MKTITPEAPPLSVDQARVLADDLIRELSGHVADRDEINAALIRWLDVLDHRRFAFVCMAALQQTFIDCLTVVPPTRPQPGDVTYQQPEGAK